MTKQRALCPECGKSMIWVPTIKVWDCGPEDEGGHGFWNPEDNYFEYDDKEQQT